MTPEELERRAHRAQTETMVIRELEDGFHVHPPTARNHSFVVQGSVDAPTCTCPDYTGHADDPEWRCKHILAVFNRALEPQAPVRSLSSEPIREETANGANGTPVMLVKRSVSPDGRIDALSIEFSTPVTRITRGDILARADVMLTLQRAIVERFLNGGNGKAPATTAPEPAQGEAVPAEMLDLLSMNTKWGPRLFLRFDVDGRVLRLFGTQTELAASIAAAGFPEIAETLEVDDVLGLPCRVTTEPSRDGRFVNIDKVLPLKGPAGGEAIGS